MTNTSKPAKSPFAKAIRTEDGEHWLGQFSMAGLVPDFVKENGQLHLFEHEGAAHVSACVALVGLLMSRVRSHSNSPQELYKRLTGDEVAVALAEVNVTPSLFAELYGISRDRLWEIIDGARPAPHAMRMLLALLKRDQTAIDFAEEITNAVTTARKKEIAQ